MRYYAKVVAQYGSQFLDNDGSDSTKNRASRFTRIDVGTGDYPVTPEAHMRNIRKLGETAVGEPNKPSKQSNSAVTRHKRSITT